MNRFSKVNNPEKVSLWIPAAMTAGILVLAFGLSSAMENSTEAKERENLEQALEQSVTLCYALEGSYPESLSYLKEHYGLQWEEDRFLVDFESIGSNLPPDITVIPRN